MGTSTGAALVGLGIVLVLVGLIAWSGALAWFGRLPGDIRVEKPGVRIHAPFMSMLVLSLAISAVLAIVRWWRS